MAEDLELKITQAIQPLLARITALEEDNTKIRLELAALQHPQPKNPIKPGPILLSQELNPTMKSLKKSIPTNLIARYPPTKPR